MLADAMKSDDFRCDGCDGVFLKRITDQAALGIGLERFPALHPSRIAVVCEVCYQQMKADGVFGDPAPPGV